MVEEESEVFKYISSPELEVSENCTNNSVIRFEVDRAERAILSSYIYNYSEVIAFSEIESISPLFFRNRISRTIFQLLSEVEVVNGKYDLVLICDALKKNNKFSQQFLDNCIKYLGSLSRDSQYYNFRKYLEILRNNWIKEELNSLSKEIIHTHWNLETINDLISKWERSFLEIVLKDRRLNYSNSREIIRSYDELLELGKKENYLNFLKTGFAELDRKIKGLKPGQFVVIASRPGVGKTTFALNLINNNLHCIEHQPEEVGIRQPAIGIFSLEMVNEVIIEKLIAMHSKTELPTLQRLLEGKKIKNYSLAIIENSKERISSTNLLFCDESNITLGKILATIKFWSRRYDLKLVVIDYLQLINLPLDKELNNMNQYQKIGLISRQLKVLSMELNTCILALSQLNRKLEDRKGYDKAPVLSDLRESGSIEQDADIVLFLFPTINSVPREGEYSQGELKWNSGLNSESISEVTLKIGKNRYGPVGTTHLHFEKKLGLFTPSTHK